MNALKILALCMSTAMICASIRSQHPQIASAVALACGAAVLALSLPDLQLFSQTLSQFESKLPDAAGDLPLLRLCGIALIAEFASDICRDSGESALARRIDTGTKIAMLASALPAAAGLMESIAELMP